MNYRHGYHAGNFADVLKHTALCELLRLLTAKDKKLFVLDTHAGAGGYDLGGDWPSEAREAEAGIARLAAAARAPCPPPWRAISRRSRPTTASSVRRAAHCGAIPARRGSFGRPCAAATGSSPANFIPRRRWRSSASSPATARSRCGRPTAIQAMKALLPPPERRGLVLIDPPFEATDEFDKLLRAVRHGLRRFATGCYAIWYPIKDADAAAAFIAALAAPKALRLELRIDGIAEGKLAACGLPVINPPWRFEEAMREALPWIAGRLGPGVSAAISAPPASAPVPA